MELRAVGRFVEVEVPSEGLISSLSRHDHLDPHCLDLTCEQKHGRTSTDGGHVIRLEVIDHVRDGVDALLDGEGEAVVIGPNVLGDFLGGDQIG